MTTMASTIDIPVAELSVAGKEVRYVDSVVGGDRLSQLFSYDVVARDPAGAAQTLDDMLGKDCTLTLKTRLGDSVKIRGVVMTVERATEGGWVVYGLNVQPAVAPLAHGSDHRAFLELNVIDIVKQILTSAGVTGDQVEWSTSGSYDPRAYTVQYGESDWEFIDRITADVGIYYFFAHDDSATKLVFADDTSQAASIAGDPALHFASGSGLLSDTDVVADLRLGAIMASDKVRLVDYNFDKPAQKLDQTAADGDGAYELYDFPGRFAVAADGKTRAQRKLERVRAERTTLIGRTSATRMRTGLSFSVTGHANADYNASWLCVGITVTAHRYGREGKNATPGLSMEWIAIPHATVFRPQREAIVCLAKGPQTGVMVGLSGKDLHTDPSGRIRVQFPWDRVGKRDEKASTWMRVGQFAMGNSMVRPRIGWNLLVEHHEGDMDAPFVSSHLYDGEHPVPYALPANKTRTSWQTATTGGAGGANEVRFEDKAGSEEMYLNASKDMGVKVGDSKFKTVGVNHSHEIGSNHDINIGSANDLGVVSDQKTSIGAAELLTVGGNRCTAVGGSETSSIGAARTMTVVKGSTVDANGGRTLTVGASMIGVSALGVSRSVLGSCSITVGSAWVCAAATGLANSTVGSSAETVGGAKIQLGAGGVTLGLKGALAETVGGAYISTAGGSLRETAKGALEVDVGGAFIANSPSILIEADNEIKLVCGGSSITITSSSIEVKSASLASPGATVKKDGSAIHHNP